CLIDFRHVHRGRPDQRPELRVSVAPVGGEQWRHIQVADSMKVLARDREEADKLHPVRVQGGCGGTLLRREVPQVAEGGIPCGRRLWHWSLFARVAPSKTNGRVPPSLARCPAIPEADDVVAPRWLRIAGLGPLRFGGLRSRR